MDFFFRHSFKLIPIMVGNVSGKNASQYGQLFGPYLDDPDNFFVISSDFCHWGSRFGYTLYEKGKGEIYEFISWLDKEGMNAIETGDVDKFSSYLKKYRNTICGRNPIKLLLESMTHCKTNMKVGEMLLSMIFLIFFFLD